MAPESIMPPGPAEQPAKPQCSTQPNIFTPTTAPHGAQGLRLRRRSVAGLANLKNNSSAAEPLRIAGFAGFICGRMSTPGHAVTGPQSPPNHILKAMARYRVSQSEEGGPRVERLSVDIVLVHVTYKLASLGLSLIHI